MLFLNFPPALTMALDGVLEGSLRQRLTGRYSEALAQVRRVVLEDGALQRNKPSKHIKLMGRPHKRMRN